jgi:hypothetical protein
MLVAPPPEEPPLADPPPDEPPLEPELPPPLGMLELEPPELPDDPPDEPDEPDEPPDEGLGMEGEGMLDDEDEESAQPPIKNEAVALTKVACAAMTNSRRSEWRVDIAWSPVALVSRTHSLESQLSIASSSRLNRSAST